MANVVNYPAILDRQEFPFRDGSTLALVSDRPITVRDAVYMCEEVKLQLMEMLRNLPEEEAAATKGEG